MATNFLTTNMNLLVPVVGQELAPTWASDLNTSLGTIDGHNHSAGSGVQIGASGLNIQSDFPINGNNLTLIRTTRFQAQGAALSASTDKGCLYEAGVDLYYNDGSGNQIRITQSGSVAGSSGTITGLPSGTASAAYSAGVFTFQSATNTSAVIDGQSFIFRNNTASSHGVTVSAPSALGSDYTLTLPTIPVSQLIMTLDNSGNISAPYSVDNSTIQIVTNLIQVKDSGITTAKIANLAITAAKIANATITGTQISSNVDLPGTAATSGGKNIITSNSPAAKGLTVIRGILNANASIKSGEGFTAALVSPGVYTITYSIAFGDTPSFIATTASPGTFVSYTSIGVGSVALTIVDETATNVSEEFSFIIIGQRA